MFDSNATPQPADPRSRGGPYSADMVASAHDVATALRQRQPDLPTKKLHKLLYYCQGHHIAATGQPLFKESIGAWDMGPVVGQLWHLEHYRWDERPDPRDLSEVELNTVGYVLSRYGALTGLDLEHLTHQEDPWKIADRGREPGTSVRIELAWIRDYFTRPETDDEADAMALDASQVKAMLSEAQTRRNDPSVPDSREDVLARLRGKA